MSAPPGTPKKPDPASTISSERVEFPSRRGNLLVGDIHRAGAGSSRWLVLCHGMESTRGGTKQTAIVQRFVPLGYNVLRFDFSYVGDSEGDYEDLTVSGEVADALGALDFMHEFGASDCTLVGSSLGGLVALLAAAQAPHLVSRVAVIAPVADAGIFTEGLSDKAIAEWRARGRRRVGSGFLRPSFLDDVLRIDAPAAMKGLAMPVLVMHGEADDVVPVAHAELVRRSVAGACSVETFPGVGHRFEEPGALDRLLDVLSRWLAGGGAAGSEAAAPAGDAARGTARDERGPASPAASGGKPAKPAAGARGSSVPDTAPGRPKAK